MPIYEFRCNGCGRKMARFFRSVSSETEGVCDHCGGSDLQRLISKFRVIRPPIDHSSINKAELLKGVDYTDSGSMANFFRRMGDTFGDEPNEHMNEIVGRLDKGEAVDKALEMDTSAHSRSEEG